MPLGLGLGLGPLLLYCIAVAAFLLSIFWRPSVGLYYLLLLVPLQTIRYSMIRPFFLGEKFVLLMTLGVILGQILRGKPVFAKTPLNALLGVYTLYNFFSLWWGSAFLGAPWPLSLDDRRTSDWIGFMMMPLLMYAVSSVIRDRRQMAILLCVMGASIFLVDWSVYSVLRYRDRSTFSEDLRYGGTLGFIGANGMGAFQAQVCSFLLAWIAYEWRSSIKLFSVLLGAFSAFCLLFSFSRGAYAAMLMGAAFVAATKKRILFIPLAIVLISWQTLVPTAVQQRILMTFDEGKLDHSAAGRINLWNDAVESIATNPVIGTGIYTYQYYNKVEGMGDPHNYYMEVTIETGLVGLLLFLTLGAKALHLGYSLSRKAEDRFLAGLGLGLSAWMVCVLVGNLFGDRWTFLELTGYTYALLGCVIRGHRILKEEARQPDERNVAIPVSVGNIA